MNTSLVSKAQKGNDIAFLKLFEQYEEEIYRMSYVYVKNESDALDVVQEVAYQSFRKIATLKNPAFFKTWLMKITINCAINVLRKNKKIIQLDPNFDEFLGSEEEDLPLSFTLQELIDHLDEEEKNIVLLRFYQDYTFKEVSELLNIPLGTAKSILYRALKKLRKELDEEGYYEQYR